MLTVEQVTEAVLEHCDGTFKGSRASLPELNGDELENFIKSLTEQLNKAMELDAKVSS